jgi:hypothetical protein
MESTIWLESSHDCHMDKNSMGGNYISMSFVEQKSQRLKAIFLLGIGIIAIIFLYIFNPSGSIIYPPCPFHALTGFYCPGCGSLRALHQLVHGHLLKAFGLNPLMILSLPFLGNSYLCYIIDGVRGASRPKNFIPAFYIWLLLGIIIIFWILRNIAVYPFSLLAP